MPVALDLQYSSIPSDIEGCSGEARCNYTTVWTGKYLGEYLTRYIWSGEHSGVDINVVNAPVYSIGECLVVKNERDDENNYTVVLSCEVEGLREPRIFPAYMHLLRSCVTVGDQISAGQQIGISGTTKSSEVYTGGAHLHFQIDRSYSITSNNLVEHPFPNHQSPQILLSNTYDPIALILFLQKKGTNQSEMIGRSEIGWEPDNGEKILDAYVGADYILGVPLINGQPSWVQNLPGYGLVYQEYLQEYLPGPEGVLDFTSAIVLDTSQAEGFEIVGDYWNVYSCITKNGYSLFMSQLLGAPVGQRDSFVSENPACGGEAAESYQEFQKGCIWYGPSNNCTQDKCYHVVTNISTSELVYYSADSCELPVVFVNPTETCEDECVSGVYACINEHEQRSCGNYDRDDCRELGPSYDCAVTCSENSDCSHVPSCGDGIAEGDEECDGLDLRGSNCLSLMYYGGSLGCMPDCRYQLNQCEAAGFCGDGVLQPLEEECDGTHMGEDTCQSIGYYYGTVSCAADCRNDYHLCSGFCGDGIAHPSETCDGSDMGTTNCRDYGYWFGPGACYLDCQFDDGDCLSIISLDAGATHSCAIISDGTVRCWGRNQYGQLGNGTTVDSLSPVATTALTGARSISSGLEFTCATLVDGLVKCWGRNSHGQLGNNSTVDAQAPSQVSGITNASKVSVANYHACAVTTAGEVRCWGNNTYGQLGNGNTTNSLIPVTVTGISNISNISVGLWHSCANTTTGMVYCWGSNADGKLGNGNTIHSSTPVQVSSLNSATWISLGQNHSCALRNDGKVFCWGGNDFGQLGVGNLTSQFTPTEVIGVSGSTQVEAGEIHTCAIVSGVGAKCWGYNNYAQLGNGTYTNSSTPVSVTNGSDFRMISGGGNHSCGIKSGDGWCWGWNMYGQLGHGQTSWSQTPVEIVE